MKSIRFHNEDLTIHFSTYDTTGALAVSLFAKDGPYCRLSVNLDQATMDRLPDDAFYLKDYAENAPIARFLLDNGILVRVYSNGHVVDSDDDMGLIAFIGDTWVDAVRFNRQYQP